MMYSIYTKHSKIQKTNEKNKYNYNLRLYVSILVEVT